jgi:hypothetical protein
MNIYNTIIIVSLITLSPLIIPLVDTQFVKSLEPYQNSSIWFPFSFVLLCPIMWHTFVSLPLDGFTVSITPLVSSSLLILGPSTSSPNVIALSMKKPHRNTSKPSHDFLVHARRTKINTSTTRILWQHDLSGLASTVAWGLAAQHTRYLAWCSPRAARPAHGMWP